MREGDYNRSWLVPMLKGIAGELEDAHADVAYWYNRAMTFQKKSEELEVQKKSEELEGWEVKCKQARKRELELIAIINKHPHLLKEELEEIYNENRETKTTHSDCD